MKKRSLAALAVTVLGMVFVFAVVYAAQQAADEMTMNSKAYDKHKKALVTFTHKKHNVDYKISCADCHHVYECGKNVWKEGNDVQKCDVCHSQAKAPTGKDAPKLSKKEKIAKYHYSAIHENCVGCHKDLKKAGKPTGPTACKQCHPQKPS
ncbi:MAG: cytochrome c3 family protein [Deltaproteobacteria bacterium]|nr:cytochrome c3 family protein [Deltaproteobacteria bacterium]